MNQETKLSTSALREQIAEIKKSLARQERDGIQNPYLRSDLTRHQGELEKRESPKFESENEFRFSSSSTEMLKSRLGWADRYTSAADKEAIAAELSRRGE